jgi:hypothetical protein
MANSDEQKERASVDDGDPSGMHRTGDAQPVDRPDGVLRARRRRARRPGVERAVGRQ